MTTFGSQKKGQGWPTPSPDDIYSTAGGVGRLGGDTLYGWCTSFPIEVAPGHEQYMSSTSEEVGDRQGQIATSVSGEHPPTNPKKGF